MSTSPNKYPFGKKDLEEPLTTTQQAQDPAQANRLGLSIYESIEKSFKEGQIRGFILWLGLHQIIDAILSTVFLKHVPFTIYPSISFFLSYKLEKAIESKESQRIRNCYYCNVIFFFIFVVLTLVSVVFGSSISLSEEERLFVQANFTYILPVVLMLILNVLFGKNVVQKMTERERLKKELEAAGVLKETFDDEIRSL